MKPRPTIGAIIIAQNEEPSCRACSPRSVGSMKSCWLTAVRQTEPSRSPAPTSAGFQRPFDNFARQQNYALSLPESDWILSLDADERPTPAMIEEIQAVVSDGRYAGYRVRVRSSIFGRPMRFSGTQDDRQVRLVRRAQAPLGRRSPRNARGRRPARATARLARPRPAARFACVFDQDESLHHAGRRGPRGRRPSAAHGRRLAGAAARSVSTADLETRRVGRARGLGLLLLERAVGMGVGGSTSQSLVGSPEPRRNMNDQPLPLLPLVFGAVPKSLRQSLSQEGVPFVDQAVTPAGGRFVIFDSVASTGATRCRDRRPSTWSPCAGLGAATSSRRWMTRRPSAVPGVSIH